MSRTKEELDRIESGGLRAAIRFLRKIPDSRVLDNSIVKELHRTIFRKASPLIAGKFRECDLKKLKYIMPPPGRKIEILMKEFENDFVERQKLLKKQSEYNKKTYDEVIFLAAWGSHEISAIHPFEEGNGRTARILINVVLKKYGLLPVVNIRDKDHDRYLDALHKIDLEADYEPFKIMILESISLHLKKLEKIKKNYQRTDHKHKK